MAALKEHVSRHTVDVFSPNTEALERIVLSMKLKLYVTNSNGMIQKSIFRKTRFANGELRASCELSKASPSFDDPVVATLAYILSSAPLASSSALRDEAVSSFMMK